MRGRGRKNLPLLSLLLLGWICSCVLSETTKVEGTAQPHGDDSKKARGGGGGGGGDYSDDKGKSLASMLDRASTWLWSQRDPEDAGWGNETALVLLGLRLVDLSRQQLDLATVPDVEFKLSAKQLELEIVLMLWKHRGEFESSAVRSSHYAMALNAMCTDPRQFHGHDLIGTLLQHHDEQRPLNDYEFAVTSLAACTAQVHIRKRQMRRLLDIAHTAQDRDIETIVMDILTLRCIVQDHRHRNLQHFLQKPLITLVQRQRQDGSFDGDLHTTALALQALEEIENELVGKWNKTATLAWLSSHQKPDGSFGDLKTTAEVVLSLVPRGVVSVRFLDCSEFKSSQDPPKILEKSILSRAEEATTVSHREEVSFSASSTTNETPVSTEAGPKNFPKNLTPQMINVSYTLWVGSDIGKIYNLTLTAPKNETFYEVMLLAARRSADFEFSAYDWPNGHYVHTLAGYKEEPMSYHYWLLFRLPSPPEPSSPPGNQFVAPGGVDDLKISPGEHYLFWYKKL